MFVHIAIFTSFLHTEHIEQKDGYCELYMYIREYIIIYLYIYIYIYI
jgi:hypothetical protein